MINNLSNKNLLLAAGVAVLFHGGLIAQTKPVFSEDFESGQIDPKIWNQKLSGAATLEVQQDQAAHGKYALKVHYPDNSPASYAMIVAAHLPDSVRTHFFGRAYVKVSPLSPESRHTAMIQAGQAGWPDSKFEEIGYSAGVWQPSFQENKSKTRPDRGEVVKKGEPVPDNKWFLLEWEFNDNPSTITLWVDGQKSPATDFVLAKMAKDGPKKDVATFTWPLDSETTSGLVGGFEEFNFGARVFGSVKQAFDIYYDDIVIDTKPIGPASGPVNPDKK